MEVFGRRTRVSNTTFSGGGGVDLSMRSLSDPSTEGSTNDVVSSTKHLRLMAISIMHVCTSAYVLSVRRRPRSFGCRRRNSLRVCSHRVWPHLKSFQVYVRNSRRHRRAGHRGSVLSSDFPLGRGTGRYDSIHGSPHALRLILSAAPDTMLSVPLSDRTRGLGDQDM